MGSGGTGARERVSRTCVRTGILGPKEADSLAADIGGWHDLR
jgi:hypothetical protein